MSSIKNKLETDKYGWDLGSTVYWASLLLILFAYILNEISEEGWKFEDDITSFMIGGITLYFVTKTISDPEKRQPTDEKHKTTLGIKPGLARGILAIVVVLTYIILWVGNFDGNVTFKIDRPDENDTFIQSLFLIVLGYYAPYFVKQAYK